VDYTRNGMILESVHLRGAASGHVRSEEYDGRDHLVLPVIALIGDQIIHAVNAGAPERVTIETLTKAVESFNQKPVVFGHPVDANRKQISANSPAILASHGIGIICNSRMSGPRLLMDVYIDPVKAEKIGGAQFVDDLRASKPCDVSIGAFVSVDDTPGELNGKRFAATWRETNGDHLAVLWPHMQNGVRRGVGACSWESGCGIRAAMHLVTAEGMELLMPKSKFDALKARILALAPEGLKERMAALFDTPEQAASEEAAELVAYNAMRTLMDGVGAQWDEASGLINDLIADEEENPTETPGQEEAEEEVETARLDAVRMHCYSMIAALQSVCNACSEQQMPDALPVSDPRYMEQFKALIGKAISAKNLSVIQKAHDSSHDMHSQTVALGAACNGMKLLGEKNIVITRDGQPISAAAAFGPVGIVPLVAAKEDCPTCNGSGSVAGKTCPTCDGEGTVLKAAAAGPQLKAACGCQGESTMDKKVKAELIAGLVTDKHSGWKEGDEAFLETAADARLEEFKAAAAVNKTEAEAKVKSENALRAAEAKLTVIEGKLKAAEQAPTEDEWLAKAPGGIKTLLDRQKAQDTEEREGLIKQLKGLGANTEDELKAMGTPQLKTLAQYAKVKTIDFSARGVPRIVAAGAEEEKFTPPDPYADGIKALQGQTKSVN
jgi:hypothetical protein